PAPPADRVRRLLERTTGFEPATPTLARLCSATRRRARIREQVIARFRLTASDRDLPLVTFSWGKTGAQASRLRSEAFADIAGQPLVLGRHENLAVGNG